MVCSLAVVGLGSCSSLDSSSSSLLTFLVLLFGMRLVNSQETQVVCHQEHPCFKGHTRVGIVLETMVAAMVEDLLCVMMMKMPLVMPFIQGVLFGMHLVNSQETQVVCL
jgi:hypothetical protein